MIDIITEIFTDGSSLMNPGKSGYAFIIKYYRTEPDQAPKQCIVTGSEGFSLSTNNRMEMMAIANGLEKLREIIQKENLTTKRINLFTDSKMISDGINQNWIQKWKYNNWLTASNSAVKNKDLWQRLDLIISWFKENQFALKVIWIKGHNGNTYNELADRLAGEAAVKKSYSVDAGYSK